MCMKFVIFKLIDSITEFFKRFEIEGTNIKELFNVRDELKQILSSGNAVYAVERGKYFFNHCDSN